MRENNGTTVRSKSKGTNKGPAALPRNDFLKLELKKKIKERENKKKKKKKMMMMKKKKKKKKKKWRA